MAPGLISDWFSRKFGAKIGISLLKNLFNYEKQLERDQRFDMRRCQNVNLMYVDTLIIEKAKELSDEKFGFGKENLIPIESEMATPKKPYDIIIHDLRKYMESKDIHALIHCYAIIQLEDQGVNKYARKGIQDLTKRFGERGRRIYNMVRSEVFDEFIHPSILDIEELTNNKKEAHRIGSKLIESLIEYNPVSIWVNDTTEKEELERGVTKRLVYQMMPFVKVFGRGDDVVNLIQNTCQEFIDNYPDYGVQINDYGLRGLPATEHVIKLLKRPKIEEEEINEEGFEPQKSSSHL